MIYRYDPEIHYSGYSTGNMEKQKDGDYVKYSDYFEIDDKYGDLYAENGILSDQKRFYIKRHDKMIAGLYIFRDKIEEIESCDDRELTDIMLKEFVSQFSQWITDRKKGKEYV